MKAISAGLIEWQVSESRIFSEAFGPASLKRAKTRSDDDSVAAVRVQFRSTQESICWDNQCESLLELAEANGIVVDSGCRAGSCGTCQTAILRGRVQYPNGMQVDCDPGQCLTCSSSAGWRRRIGRIGTVLHEQNSEPNRQLRFPFFGSGWKRRYHAIGAGSNPMRSVQSRDCRIVRKMS